MRFGIYLLSVTLAFAAADKKLPLEQTSNETVEISAHLMLDKEQVKREVGSELDGIVVVQVTVRPLTDKPVKIDRDDFMLLDTNDGQRATPFGPTQIAGNSTLVVGTQGVRTNRTSFGGGFGGFGMGSGGVPPATQDTVKVKNNNDPSQTPLLAALKEKVLPEKEVSEPITGLLFFQIDGKKLKAKDFEMYYKKGAERISMRFRP